MLPLFCVSEYVKYIYVVTGFFEWVRSEERITRILLLTENGQVLVEKNLLLLEKLEVMAAARRGLRLSAWSIEDEGRIMRLDININNMSDFFCLLVSHTEV